MRPGARDTGVRKLFPALTKGSIFTNPDTTNILYIASLGNAFRTFTVGIKMVYIITYVK